tara:strand:- start:91 stop:1014 length:924 start_codon:yes stop_codon:yes gene_type:complete
MALLGTTNETYYEGSDGVFNTSDDLGVYGNYQYVSFKDLVNNFMVAYVGEGKIITKIKRPDINFHAQRALQELSYDTLRSTKSQEVDVGSSLTIPLPHDYVNYVKMSWVDRNGLENLIHPSRVTSNPLSIIQSETEDANNNYPYTFDSDGNLQTSENSSTWTKYKANVSEDSDDDNDTEPDTSLNEGRRYGLDPEFSQSKGVFFIDPLKGRIHFSSNISGKTITIKYISDTLATEGEMKVHKFAEEAVYKYIAHAVLATRANTPEYLVARFKKERFAEIRKAKLRLSNIKSEELAQIMRGKSKQIKH